MSVASVEKAIVIELRTVAKNAKIKLKDLMEWSTGELKAQEGETLFFLPVLKIHCAVKLPPEKIDREEHLAWCKKRALEYLDRGDISDAWGSFVADIQKHDGTRDHPNFNLGIQMRVAGLLEHEQQMREFIEGFN